MDSNSFTIGKILGVTIKIHYTWFIVLLLVYFTLATGYFPLIYKGWSTLQYHLVSAASSLLLFASVLFHEIFHSYVGQKFGIRIKSIMLFVFGGVAQITEEPQKPKVELLMTAAGPASSLLLTAVFYALSLTPQPEFTQAIFSYLFAVNGILAVFNLVPAFPLDGGRILRSLLWLRSNDLLKATKQSVVVSRVFAYILMLLGVAEVLILGSLISGIWLGFIGWFLLQAAGQSLEQAMVKNILEKISVGQVMEKIRVAEGPEAPITKMFDELLEEKEVFGAVKEGRKILGIVTLVQIKRALLIPGQHIETVKEIMRKIESLKPLTPAMNAYQALNSLLRQEVELLPVYEHQRFVGVVTRDALLFMLSAKA